MLRARTWIVLASVTLLVALTVPAGAGQAAPRIVGGQQASLAQHPWQVAVFLWDGSEYVQGCGGVILDATHVLTAAHCLLDDVGDPYADPTDVAVLAGVDDLAADPLPDEQFIEAEDLEVMPTYGTPVEDAHDAGIITLSEPLVRGTKVQPAALTGTGAQAPAIPSGTPLQVSGWGSTDTLGNEYDSVLRAVAIKAVDDTSCAVDFPDELDAPTMLCAIDTGKDSCFGDSGGPLTMTDGLLVGLVSFGPDTCGGDAGPGVYTELAESTINAFARSSGYAPPQNTAPPSVSGTPAVGSPLTCAPGTWTGGPELAYRFEQVRPERTVARDWSASPAYTPQGADAGRALRCLVRARADAGAAIAASAATAAVPGTPPGSGSLALAVSSTAPAVGETVTVTASGTAATTSDLWWYAEPNASSCAPTRDEQAARPAATTLGARYSLTGDYTRTLEFRADQALPYRICAYLYDQAAGTAGPPLAAATLTITPVAAPGAGAPPAGAGTPSPAGGPAAAAGASALGLRLSAPGRQRLGRGTIRVRATCSRSCRLAASGRVGGRRTRGARSPAARTSITLTLRLPTASVRKLRRLLRTRRSVTATVTVRATAGADTATATARIRITR